MSSGQKGVSNGRFQCCTLPRMWQLISPSGLYKITLAEREVFNTHWLHVPSLRDVQTGVTILALGEQWSLDESAWQSDSVVTLTLRKYPGNHSPSDVVAIADLEQRLDGALTWIYG